MNNFGDVRLKLMLTVAVYNDIKQSIILRSFVDIGIWPMNYRIVPFAKKRWNEQCIINNNRQSTEQKCLTMVSNVSKNASQAISGSVDAKDALRRNKNLATDDVLGKR